MRGFLAAVLVACALPARAFDWGPSWRAADWRVSDRAVVGGGRYSGDDFQTGVLFPSRRWDVSARVKTFRFLDEFSGDQTEYSGRLERKLPHVSVSGRLGTAPPDSQRLSYRLASGEILLSFYDGKLGPEDAADAASVSEDTTTAADLAQLGKTWVTRFRGRFTTTNFHRDASLPRENAFVQVQNAWQFDLSETWKEMTTLTLHNGHDRYSQLVTSSDPVFSHWNLDYQGAPIALKGWPNNHVGADVAQRWNDWSARAGFTRINMLFGGLEILAGGEAAWRPAGRQFEARAGWYQHTTRGVSVRSAWTFGGAYRW